MKPALCLCTELVPRPTSSHLRVVAHDFELEKSTNSGRFLPLLLERGAIVAYGGRHPKLNPRCWPDGTRPVVLYPAQGAPLISSFVDANKPPVCLIVLDGTWHQARRLRKDFAVAGVPFAQLPPDDDDTPESVYSLRTGHFEGSRSTLEAAARALAILERDRDVEEHLLRPFRMMVSRTLWLRGSVDAGDVVGGLPEGVQRHDINTRGYADGRPIGEAELTAVVSGVKRKLPDAARIDDAVEDDRVDDDDVTAGA